MAYDLQPVKAPRLAGILLKLVANLAENRWTKWLLIPNLLQAAGVPRLRKLKVDEPTTNHPFHLPSGLQQSQESVTLKQLDRFLKDDPKAEIPAIADYAAAYRNGSASPVSVAEAAVRAMEESNSGDPSLNAFTFYDQQEVMGQAKASEERLKNGSPLSVIDGVPVAIKDELDMVPFPTTVGTKFLGKEPAEQNATVVERLRNAGALLIGKTNMHEIGIGVTGLNPHDSVVRNPYHTGHYSGGSSSGSAAAVAAGICPGAIGADGGGSVRIPASLCGVTGLKPTFGRISEHGAAPLCWSVAHIGPLTATVDDTAILYSIISGRDTNDSWSMKQPPVHLNGLNTNDLSGLRIGIYPEWFGDASEDVVDQCQKAVGLLTDAGAERANIEISNLDAFRVAHAITISSEMAAAMDPYYDKHRKDFGLDVRINLAMARSLTGRDYIKAQRTRTMAIREFFRILNVVDVIITPSTACTAPPIPKDALPDGESNLEVLTELMRFASMANFTGLPALSVPVGYDSNGMPVGVQLIGRPWEESLLMRLGKVIETGMERRKPGLWYSILNESEK